jgi:hypothetical protein
MQNSNGSFDFDLKEYLASATKATDEINPDENSVEFVMSHAMEMVTYFAQAEKQGLDVLDFQLPEILDKTGLLELIIQNSLADIQTTTPDLLKDARAIMNTDTARRMMFTALCIGIGLSIKEEWR